MPGFTNIHIEVLDELIDHLYGPIDGKACERAAEYVNDHCEQMMLRLHKTIIPDEWPSVARFPTDGVRMAKQEGDIRWLCPVCKKTCYAADEIAYIKCPVCGVNIKRMKANSLAGVD